MIYRLTRNHDMHSTYNLNERLLSAVHRASYEDVLDCLCDGAKATFVSVAHGRTAVGVAAVVGDAEILELLIQSCEEPLDIFTKNCSNSIEMETVDSTPDGMDNLEWEDEFIGDNDGTDVNDSSAMEDDTSLYFYYAKTFERTGAIIGNQDDFCPGLRSGGPMQQDPHACDSMLMTPLHYATACAHLDCARLLLEHGARADAINVDGITPLHLAESADMARLLLQNGANPNLKTLNTGETALHLALRHRCTSVAIVILQTSKVNINETDDELDQTPLMCAILFDLDDMAGALLDMGARINLQDREGHTALYNAVQRKNVKLATRLLALGARRVTAHYLLHHCVHHNMREMAKLLLSYGYCLNVRNKDGMTPIMLAIWAQQPKMLDFLLEVAATDGRVTVDRAENELIMAVQYIDALQEFAPIARLIFAYGDQRWMRRTMATYTCYIPYCHCHTPLALAVMLNKLDIAAFLIKEGVDITQICHDHIVNHLRSTLAPGCLELSQLLIHAGFKFSQNKFPVSTNCLPEQRSYEEAMRRLCSTPLTLQSQARIVIRRQLTHKMMTDTEHLPTECHATKLESGLSRMINKMDIPKTLRIFLIHFDDCPSVNNSKTDTHLPTEQI